jgi:hypothetical protein
MIDKKHLQEILSQPFHSENWTHILKEVFGVKNILQKPSQILLPSNKKAESAFELGSFSTSDDRIIGLYLVKVKPEVWLERNKVGLRELLRSVYKYEVDGALIVFEQQDKWRLSFVSEIRTFDEQGRIITKITEPKRYTYLLGHEEKTKTPATRLTSIAGKAISLEDIRTAFSVEALNEEFYKIVARHFYQLVGATEGKGAKVVTYESVLKLPGINPKSDGASKIYQEFAVRLIGRSVFCWFLKVKKSASGISLLPEQLLSSEAVKKNRNYYHCVLEKLFFQTLNTPIEQRIDNLTEAYNQVPFLNGGLFEPQVDDYYKPNRVTGLSDNINTLKIPDEWFKEFFENLEQYNFTIDENSVVDIEVSVDPEMLGRIFENLLAEIDPDSGETARKATGSFYTPREIVDYMAIESLVHYLHNQTKIEKELLIPIFKIDSEVSFSVNETEKILDALDRVKILDPACGSGAFPIGILQKIVMALQKLDNDANWWKGRQLSKIDNIVLRKKLKEKLQHTTVEYARKIGIIQNSLYGVDIQPIAAEISKLRCFLTLVVDENIDDDKPNRGIEPLPNLEFKFVTANTLLKLPAERDFGGLFNANDDLEQLQQIRLEYLQSFGDSKLELKNEFKRIQNNIVKQQIKGGTVDPNSKSFMISNWDPFSNQKVDWFDTIWMFGVEGFNLLIGNPPYGTSIKGTYRKRVELLYGKVPDYEIYYYFIESAKLLLHENGILSYIIPNTYLFNTFAESYRNKLLKEWLLVEILDCTNFQVFKSAVVRNTINTWQNGKGNFVGYRNTKGKSTFDKLISTKREFLSADEMVKFNHNWGLAFSLDKITIQIIEKIKLNSRPLEKYFPEISQGLIAYDKYQGQSEELIKNRIFHYTEKIKDNLKPWLWGSDVNRYKVEWNEKEYIDYCDGIANPRLPKFFMGDRILIREITNPSIFAGFTDKELYNDPSIIIVLDNPKFPIKSLLGILNSKLATYFHFHNSPKATKGAFPKLLVKDIKEFPLKEGFCVIAFTNIVEYILFLMELKEAIPVNEYVPNSHIVQLFEDILDAMVYELYFDDDFKRAGIAFMKYVERDFISIENKGNDDVINIIHSVYQKIRKKDNEIRQNLKLMDTRLADLIMPIKTAKQL